MESATKTGPPSEEELTNEEPVANPLLENDDDDDDEEKVDSSGDDENDGQSEEENNFASGNSLEEQEKESAKTIDKEDSDNSLTAESLHHVTPPVDEVDSQEGGEDNGTNGDDGSAEKDEDRTDGSAEKVEKRTKRTNGSTTLGTIILSPKWSDALQSPINSCAFSPSLTGAHHGLGLKLARERNMSTALFLGNISMFLSSMATVYEHFGTNLVKISRFVSPEQLSFKLSIGGDLESLYKAIMSLGNDFRNSAECYRTTIVASLQKTLASNGNERDIAIKRYKEMKQTSAEARTAALANYSTVMSAVKAAEMEIQAWASKVKRRQKDESTEDRKENDKAVEINETDLPWEKSLKVIGKNENEIESTLRLIQKLKIVQVCKTQYAASVERENDCVNLSQEREALALSEAEKAEEDQINFYTNTVLTKVFPKEKDEAKLDALRASFATADSERSFGIEMKKTSELFSTLNLFKQQSTPYEEGMGVMDAETLGLPSELGIQRDNVKSCFTARGNRIKVTEIIVKFFEESMSLSSKSSLKIRSHITNQRRKDATEMPSSGSFPSSQAGSLWRTTLGVFEDEVNLISGLGFKLAKLERWLTTCKRNLENEIDLDDAAWKQLCDAARAETKLEARYRQTKQQLEKVRQRASSRELSLKRLGSLDSAEDNTQPLRKRLDSSGSTGSPLTPNKVGRSFFKGGEAFFKGGEAMKKLTENAMSQIAQIGMNEVDQKEAKDQLALEEATVAKKRAMTAYSSYTKVRIEKFNAEDESGWSEMKEVIDKLIESVNALNKLRSHAFENRISQELEGAVQSMVTNTEEWVENVRDEILTTKEGSSGSTGDVPEYTLTMKPIKSHNIDQILCMTEDDETIPELIIELNPSIEQSEERFVDDREITPKSGSEKNTEEESKTPPTPEKEATIHSQSISDLEREKHLASKTENLRSPEKKGMKPEIKAFIKQFWSNKPKDQEIPDIIEIHSCAYRPKERVSLLTPSLNGRLFTTKEAIYFLAADKNFTLRWEKVTTVEKEKGFMGSNNDTDLVISYRSDNEIASFLLCRLDARDKVVSHLQSLKAQSEHSKTSQAIENSSVMDEQLPPVPPDPLLKGMDIVVSKMIKNISIKSVFDNVWADRSDGESFYGSWLGEEECYDITMEEWKIAEGGAKFKNEWCNEEYDQERLVTFKFNRTTHLYIGPPVAFVKQRHFIRVEGNDKCILAISAEFEGIPYADTFAVEMRWVAARKGSSDVHVQVGLFVNFKKKTMLRSQIKSGTIDETKNVHLRLFDAVKKACKQGDQVEREASEEDEDVDDVVIEDKEAEPSLLAKLGDQILSLDPRTVALSLGAFCLVFAGNYVIRAIFGSSGPSDTQLLENRIQDLQDEVRALHKSMDLVTGLLKEMKNECRQSTKID